MKFIDIFTIITKYHPFKSCYLFKRLRIDNGRLHITHNIIQLYSRGLKQCSTEVNKCEVLKIVLITNWRSR